MSEDYEVANRFTLSSGRLFLRHLAGTAPSRALDSWLNTIPAKPQYSHKGFVFECLWPRKTNAAVRAVCTVTRHNDILGQDIRIQIFQISSPLYTYLREHLHQKL